MEQKRAETDLAGPSMEMSVDNVKSSPGNPFNTSCHRKELLGPRLTDEDELQFQVDEMINIKMDRKNETDVLKKFGQNT